MCTEMIDLEGAWCVAFFAQNNLETECLSFRNTTGWS